MSLYDSETYFALENFAHRALFDDSTYVWEAIQQLPAYLASAQLGALEGNIAAGATLVHPELISIGSGTVVEAGAYIAGPCIIGSNCEVRHGAYIRGQCVTGDCCVIGHCTEVKQSILLDGAKAGHFAYLGNTIVGSDANLGAGTKCANLRFDGAEVLVGPEKHPSGLRKFGAIIGDRAQIGCNAVTSPGTLIGQEANCYPTAVVSGVVPARARVKCPVSVSILEEGRA